MKVKTRVTHTIKLSDKDLRALVQYYYELHKDVVLHARVGEFFNHLDGIINPPPKL